MNIQIILNFENMEQMSDWFEEQKDFESYKFKKLITKEFENRGSKTKEYHIIAKEYHIAHPELTYRECVKLTNKNKINNLLK